MKGFITQEKKRSKSIYVLLVIVTSTMNKKQILHKVMGTRIFDSLDYTDMNE